MKLDKLARRLESRASKGPMGLTLSPAVALKLVAEIDFAETRRLQLAIANRELERIRAICLCFRRWRPIGGRAQALIAIKEIDTSARGEEIVGGRNLLDILANYISLTDPKGHGTIVDGDALYAGLARDAIRLVKGTPLEGRKAIEKLAAFYGLSNSYVLNQLWRAKKIAESRPKPSRQIKRLAGAKLPRPKPGGDGKPNRRQRGDSAGPRGERW